MTRAFGLSALLISGTASALNAHGLVLPSTMVEVGENRYRSTQSYEDTLKYFNTTYKGTPRKAIVNQPGIKAVHFESADPKSGYEGFNVYEKDKEVRIYVIPRAGEKSEKPAGKKHGSK